MVRRLLAVRAKHAHEALGEKRADRRSDEERLDAHVDETRDAADGVVGVERGEDQVAGESCADGDFRRFEVAHFPDHHDVRVAAQNRAQGASEGEVDLRLDRDLHHAGELVLDRVFHRDDAPLHGVEHGKKGVKRRAFAAAGRAGEQDDAVGLRDELADLALGGGREAKQREIEFIAGEKTEADAFAGDGGNRRDADVDGLVIQLEVDAAILRHAALGDVEIGHDLDARNHAGLQHLDLSRHGHLVEHAVDAVADAQIVFQRLDVDVSRALLERRAHDLVDETDDGRLGVVLVEDVDLLLQVESGIVDLAALEDRLECLRANAITGTQCR